LKIFINNEYLTPRYCIAISYSDEENPIVKPKYK
jgi:hypothetical protein